MCPKQINSKIEIYTDGSCLGNPGPGGWGVLIIQSENKSQAQLQGKSQAQPKDKSDSQSETNKNIKLSGGDQHTTNNRMEMTAIIKALEWLHENLKKDQLSGADIIIHSDSNLLISTLNHGWKRKANLNLWQQIDRLRAWLNIKWTWVKAHAANKHNNQVDKLALAAATKAKKTFPGEW